MEELVGRNRFVVRSSCLSIHSPCVRHRWGTLDLVVLSLQRSTLFLISLYHLVMLFSLDQPAATIALHRETSFLVHVVARSVFFSDSDSDSPVDLRDAFQPRVPPTVCVA